MDVIVNASFSYFMIQKNDFLILVFFLLI